MLILTVRHGPAIDPHLAPSDEYRWLTPEGRTVVRGVAAELAAAGLRFDRIFTSPLVRAVQTAEILGTVNDFGGTIEVATGLDPETGSTSRAIAPLEECGQGECVVLVGHEPSIRVITGHLLHVPSFPAFRAGGVCLMERDERGRAAFRWMLDPYTRMRVSSLEALRS